MKFSCKTFTALSILVLLSTSLAQAYEFYFEKDNSLPLVYVTLAFKGGATQDPDGKNGATDIMGKLMLRGTKNKTKSQIDLALDQLGASLNAETRAESIIFRGVVLSENTKPFLDLIAEIISSPSFRIQDLEKLKKEDASQLLDELSQDHTLARLRFDQLYFKGHPYSKTNVGRVKDIQTLTQQDVQRQYQKLICSQTLIALASGNASDGDFKPFLKEIEKVIPRKGSLNPIPEFQGNPKNLRIVIFDKPDRTQTQVVIGQKGVTFKDPRLDALQLANYAFGGGTFMSRLMVELRVKRGWTYGAGSSFKLSNQPYNWKVTFFPKNADTAPAVKEALGMIRELKNKGLTAEEFNFSQAAMINSAGFTYNTPEKRMENKMVEKLFGLPDGYFKDQADRIAKLDLLQVNQSLKEFINPDQVMVGMVATAETTRPEIAKTLNIPEASIEVQDFKKE